MTDAYPSDVFAALADIAGSGKSVAVRQQACLFIKNVVNVDLDDVSLQAKHEELWTRRATPAAREHVRTALLRGALLRGEPAVRTAAGQALAKIAAIEIPREGFASELEVIIDAASLDSPDTCVSCIRAIGYICENVSSLSDEVVNKFLDRVVGPLMADGVPRGAPLAAVEALNSVLECASQCFEDESRSKDREVLVDAIVMAGNGERHADPQVQLGAFVCITTLAQLYYPYLRSLMHKLTSLTSDAARSAQHMYESGEEVTEELDSIACLAVEFWTLVATRELELGAESQDLVRAHGQALVNLMVKLLMARSLEEDADDDETVMTLPIMATSALRIILQVCGRDAIAEVVEQAGALLSGAEPSDARQWRQADAACMLLGLVLEVTAPPESSSPVSTGVVPEDLGMQVPDVFGVMMRLVTGCSVLGEERVTVASVAAATAAGAAYDHPIVRETAMWTSAIALRYHAPVLPPERFGNILQGIRGVLAHDRPRVCSQAAFAIVCLAQAVRGTEDERGFNLLTPFLREVVEQLWAVYDRADAARFHLRTSAFEAINEAMGSASVQASQDVLLLQLDYALDRLEEAGQVATTTQAVYDEKDLRLSHCCGLAGTVIGRLRDETPSEAMVRAEADVRNVFQLGMPMSREDSITALVAIINASDEDAVALMPLWGDAILDMLGTPEEAELCGRAVGLVSDLSLNARDRLEPFADAIVERLLDILARGDVMRDLKPMAISALGDVAFALGHRFRRFLSKLLVHFNTAQNIPVDPRNEELAEFLEALYESLIDAYQTIVQGLNVDESIEAASELVPHLKQIFRFLEKCALAELHKLPHDADDALLARASPRIGALAQLLGDIACVVPPRDLVERCNLRTEWVVKTLEAADAIERAQWTRAGGPHIHPATGKPKTETDAEWARDLIARSESIARQHPAGGAPFRG